MFLEALDQLHRDFEVYLHLILAQNNRIYLGNQFLDNQCEPTLVLRVLASVFRLSVSIQACTQVLPSFLIKQ